MTSRSTPIAYIAPAFPGLTTTFIYREVLALRDIGFTIITCGVWRPKLYRLSEESKGLIEGSLYILPISWPKFAGAHLYFLLTNPIKYISTLLFVLTRSGESLKNRYRSLLHFFEAICLALDIKQKGVKHIHAHFEINAASIALIVARMLGITFSFTAHNNFFTDQIILKAKLKEAKFIICISEHGRDFLLGLLPEEQGLRDKIHIVHCGVSPEDFTPATCRAANERPLIFSVSQLAERKGYPVLVEACHILDQRGCDFICAIAGDGPQQPILEQLIAEYQLHDKVQLIGKVFQEQLGSYLHRADMFVLPCLVASNGDRDGVPVALMEAMATEIPTISTYVSGIPELIEDGHSGLLVQEKDAVALADAIQRLLEDAELRVRLGRCARQRIIQEFNIHRSGEQLAALFEKYVIAEQGSSLEVSVSS
jgi:colanic acid/amylovoran biosynthesis glycosyltransferase